MRNILKTGYQADFVPDFVLVISNINFFMMRSLSYKNQSIDLQRKSMDWFLYDRDLRH